jgi:hypothetical protein
MKTQTRKKQEELSIESFKKISIPSVGFVKFPKFSGRVFIASFYKSGYTNCVVAFNEKSFGHTIQRFIEQNYGEYLQFSVHVGEVVSLPDWVRTKVEKAKSKTYLHNLKCELETQLQQYFKSFQTFPKGFTELSKAKHGSNSFELSCWDQKADNFVDKFCETDKKTLKHFVEKLASDKNCYLRHQLHEDKQRIEEIITNPKLSRSIAREVTKEECENSLSYVGNSGGWDGSLGVSEWDEKFNVLSVPFFYFVSDHTEKTKALCEAFHEHFAKLNDSLVLKDEKEEKLKQEEINQKTSKEEMEKRKSLKQFFEEPFDNE